MIKYPRIELPNLSDSSNKCKGGHMGPEQILAVRLAKRIQAISVCLSSMLQKLSSTITFCHFLRTYQLIFSLHLSDGVISAMVLNPHRTVQDCALCRTAMRKLQIYTLLVSILLREKRKLKQELSYLSTCLDNSQNLLATNQSLK